MNQPPKTEQRRLGRGLEALLGNSDNQSGEAAPAKAAGAAPAGGSQKVPISKVDPNPFQPRREFNQQEIESLGQSLTEHGMIQPLVARLVEGRYQLIAGERRLRAAQKIGWNTVPIRVMEADDRQVAEVAIVENLQRTDLNPLEKAGAFKRYLDTYKCPQDELAKRIGIDRSTVANLIRLLELPEAVQEAVRKEQISAGHARALLPLGEEKEQTNFVKRIQAEGWSVRRTEQEVKDSIAQADGEKLAVIDEDGKRKEVTPQSQQVAALEQEFRTWLGTKVDLRSTSKDKGRIIIHYTNQEEFDRLRKHLSGTPAPAAKSA